MTLAAVIADARADGITLALAPDGGLKFRGPRTAADKWLPLLRQGKAAIVAHLTRAQRTEWDAADWRGYFEERAAIREYDGGSSRPEAERLAVEFCIVEWLDRHPVRSHAGRCHWCGGDGASEALVPFGIGSDVAWLHSRCWQAWYASRQAEAAAALKAVGIWQTDGAAHV